MKFRLDAAIYICEQLAKWNKMEKKSIVARITRYILFEIYIYIIVNSRDLSECSPSTNNGMERFALSRSQEMSLNFLARQEMPEKLIEKLIVRRWIARSLSTQVFLKDALTLHRRDIVCRNVWLSARPFLCRASEKITDASFLESHEGSWRDRNGTNFKEATRPHWLQHTWECQWWMCVLANRYVTYTDAHTRPRRIRRVEVSWHSFLTAITRGGKEDRRWRKAQQADYLLFSSVPLASSRRAFLGAEREARDA